MLVVTIFFTLGPLGEGNVFVKVIKISVIISIHSPKQEVPGYPQKHASILHAQKLYQVHLANSAGHDCLVLIQFELIDTYFHSR